MSYSLNQKVLRAVQFLLGLRTRRVRRALAPYGLNEDALAEAHELLRLATLVRLDHTDTEGDALVKRIDAFENHWLTIVRAVLLRRYPAVYEWVFRNISQTEGLDLFITVDAVVQRLRALADGSSPFAEQGVEAMQVLAQRGFTEARLEDGEGLIQELSQFRPGDDDYDPDSVDEAVDQLWGWYLEWSVIARRVITNRRSLRALGFLANSNPSTGNDDEIFEDEVSENEPSETEVTDDHVADDHVADDEVTAADGEASPTQTRSQERRST